VNHKSFLISLDYGDRKREREFVGSILDRFDRNTLVGAMVFVNNNIYALSCHLFLNFEKDSEIFEEWLNQYYPNKNRIYNLYTDDFMEAMGQRGCNAIGLLGSDLLELQMPSYTNEIFLHPDRSLYNEIFPPIMKEMTNYSVFLSHSSIDKPKVEIVFNELQKSNISAWFDRYQINPGDSITDKINDGLDKSKLGLLFLSKSFLDSKSGWTMSEANYFFQKRMRDKTTKFIVINMDLKHDEMPPLMQDYLYINYDDSDAINRIIDSIKSVGRNL